jgi:hypothetical protein
VTRHFALPLLLLLSAAPLPVLASGHGPVYGLATPTLGEGGWSLDVAAMDRITADSRHMAMIRPMLGYGITEDLQVSASLPVPLYIPVGAPHGRVMGMMPGNPDAEVLVNWRFHRQGTGVGSRFESTALLGAAYPTDVLRGGVRTSPGLLAGAVTGYASRSVYAWAGAMYRRYMSPVGPAADHPGDMLMYSLVFGYRPPFFQEEYPAPDWRLFVEATGEYAFRDVIAGREVASSGGHQIFVGPTVLGLYGDWGISGGPMFPVYSRLNGGQAADKVRLVVNFTRWF